MVWCSFISLVTVCSDGVVFIHLISYSAAVMVCSDDVCCLMCFTDGPNDTTPEDVTIRTYVPTLLTFEEEMQQLLATRKATPLASAQATS